MDRLEKRLTEKEVQALHLLANTLTDENTEVTSRLYNFKNTTVKIEYKSDEIVGTVRVPMEMIDILDQIMEVMIEIRDNVIDAEDGDSGLKHIIEIMEAAGFKVESAE